MSLQSASTIPKGGSGIVVRKRLLLCRGRAGLQRER
jgi:hypothetical protein